ncbi:ABC transporter substrate-binding protein [Jannaschia sp. LMIT008]|uniref:ABC transporter substrate-binding protein n=1 Tax=Jannaschia maritima TaxID=3032585 RepID=UPI0028126134|nr:ABC transporter substrate-binding protein [Jannaschia sp. LMIT008]
MRNTMLTAALLATAVPAAAQTEISVFHAWPHHAEWQQRLADDFMAANPDVTIRMLAPSTDYDEGLVSVIRQDMAGTAPDLFLVGSHLLAEVAARDLAPPMDDLLDGRDMDALGYSDAALALTQVDGVQVGLPWTSSTPVMFYNAELVRQAGGDPAAMPTTWDEAIALGKAIEALGDDIEGFYYPPGDDDWMVQNLLATANLAPLSDGTIAFDTPEGRDALALFERFHDEAGQEAIPNSAARQMMYAGKLGLYFNSTAAVRSFAREIEDRFEWGTAPMPRLTEDGGVASGGMAAVILTDDPEKRQAAMEYVLYGTGAEGQATIVQATGYMPVNDGAEALLADFYSDNPAWRTSATQMDRSLPWFAWPGQNGIRISQEVVDTITAVANDRLDTAGAAERLTSEIGALLP